MSSAPRFYSVFELPLLTGGIMVGSQNGVSRNGGSQDGRGIAKRSIILAALDLSPISPGVLDMAAGVGTGKPSEMHLVHVMKNPSEDEAGLALRLNAHTDQVKAELWELASHVTEAIERVIIHLRLGDPALEIAQLASDISADLIVVGTHGSGGLTRLLMGSAAESLAQHAPCAVLSYRPKLPSAWIEIAPPCPDCLDVQVSTGRTRLWCDRHSEHHARAHTYSEVPSSYGMGALTFR